MVERAPDVLDLIGANWKTYHVVNGLCPQEHSVTKENGNADTCVLVASDFCSFLGRVGKHGDRALLPGGPRIEGVETQSMKSDGHGNRYILGHTAYLHRSTSSRRRPCLMHETFLPGPC